MKIIHVMGSARREASGPSQSVPGLVAAQRRQGADSWLWSVEPRGTNNVRYEFQRAFPRGPELISALNPTQSSRALDRALSGAAAPGVVFHSHGLWLSANVRPALAARTRGGSFALSPRGMLATEALAFSRIKKQMFWAVQRRAISSAAFLHATAESEYREIRAAGMANPVAIIPNGVELPEVEALSGRSETRTVLSLGRLHPKKNLEALLIAWSRLEPRFPEWRLRMVGPDEGGYAAKLNALAIELGLRRAMIGTALYGREKQQEYASADLFVLCSLNENFGMTVAEALAAGTPVVVTKGAPWEAVDAAGCGWWIDQGVEALEATLGVVLGLPPETLQGMGARGRAWMEADFSWDAVAREMVEVYAWTIRGGAPPACVRLE